MAWNEPGGNKPNDPWGGGDQGPPDLDEALKKFQQKLNGIFGGSSGGSSGGGTGGVANGLTGGLVVLLLIAVLIFWAAMGFYKVDEQERGVILRLGRYHNTVGPGLHWNARLIDSVSRVTVTTERTYSPRNTVMLTEDENIVDMPLTVQYNISDAKAFVLNVRDPEISLEHATDSALRHVVGGNTLDAALGEGRQLIGDEVKLRLQAYLDDYGTGIKVIKVNIQEGKPPTEVQAAFDDVVKAKEDEERLKNEAQAYANGVVPQARGRAQRIIEEATGYRARVVSAAEGEASRFGQLLTEYQKAPQVTRERLYIDAMESVLSKSSKVMIDVDGGNNILYLPLDKLAARSSELHQPQAGASDDVVQRAADRVIDRLRRQSTTTSRRGESR
jgi:membrane protease subunit HflK